jgi:hypothetical protein
VDAEEMEEGRDRDDHYSPLKPDKYISFRVMPMLDFYKGLTHLRQSRPHIRQSLAYKRQSMAYIRESRPGSDRGVQVEVIKTI